MDLIEPDDKKRTGVEEGQNEGGGQSTLHNSKKEEDLLVIHWRWQDYNRAYSQYEYQLLYP
ncbi:MAG: hypothetical protein WB664_09635 [Nitrososphaeraceae archaeon]